MWRIGSVNLTHAFYQVLGRDAHILDNYRAIEKRVRAEPDMPGPAFRRLLKEYGIRSASTEVPFTSWEALPDLALLAVKWHKERDRTFWHWVVFWRGPCGPVVLDSKRALRRHVRIDFGRMKVKWFSPVSLIKKAAVSLSRLRC